MSSNIPYKESVEPINTKFASVDAGVSPVWANLLYKGVKNRDKLQEKMDIVKDDPTLLFKGLLGKSLLDKFIDPGLAKLLPDSIKLDVLKHKLHINPTKKLHLELGKKNKTFNLGIDYKF